MLGTRSAAATCDTPVSFDTSRRACLQQRREDAELGVTGEIDAAPAGSSRLIRRVISASSPLPVSTTG